MSTIIITPTRVESVSSDGVRFLVRQVLYSEPGSIRSLHDGNPFERADILEISLIMWRHPTIEIKLKIDSRLAAHLSHFLSHMQGKEHSFDCYDFVCETNDVPLHDKRYLLKYWQEQPRFIKRPGQVLFLVNKDKQQFRHAAIYLGHGLYISVYGKNGDLEVSTLADMKIGYDTRTALTVVPRTD